MFINPKFIVARINQMRESSRIEFNRLLDDYLQMEELTYDEALNSAYAEFNASR